MSWSTEELNCHPPARPPRTAQRGNQRPLLLGGFISQRTLKKPLCKAPAPSDDNRVIFTPNDRQKGSVPGMLTPAQNVLAHDDRF
jgi:hypothetical protein